jgi:hypothetical protein
VSRDLQGRCTCGAVGYKARRRPDKAYACHCLHCQKRTGSAFALLLPVTGRAHGRDDCRRAARSERGPRFAASLGPLPHAPLYAQPDLARLGHPAGGTLEHTSDVRPAFHIGSDERQSRFAPPADVPWIGTQPGTREAWRALLSSKGEPDRLQQRTWRRAQDTADKERDVERFITCRIDDATIFRSADGLSPNGRVTIRFGHSPPFSPQAPKSIC